MLLQQSNSSMEAQSIIKVLNVQHSYLLSKRGDSGEKQFFLNWKKPETEVKSEWAAFFYQPLIIEETEGRQEKKRPGSAILFGGKYVK